MQPFLSSEEKSRLADKYRRKRAAWRAKKRARTEARAAAAQPSTSLVLWLLALVAFLAPYVLLYLLLS